jgi:ribosomal protein S12 methylthiotransferase accessory factor YcaO
MMARTFTADLRQFKKLAKERMEQIVRDSVQDVLEGAQTTARGVTVGGTLQPGKIPVVSADLVNSLVSSVAGGGGAKGAASYAVAVAGYELGQMMQFGWTMEYALRVEYGFTGQDNLGRTYNQPGWQFVGRNASRWPEIVADNVRKG